MSLHISQVEAIFWGMINYMRFHAGDDTERCRANLYGRYWDIPGGDVKIPGGYQASVFFSHMSLICHELGFRGVPSGPKTAASTDSLLHPSTSLGSQMAACCFFGFHWVHTWVHKWVHCLCSL